MTKLTFPALKATNRLPSPPAVAMRILQLVGSDDTTLDDLAHVISADPALTAKILKYLHSPLIGLGFHGTTLVEAVARIGTRGAQLLALSFSLVSQKHHQSCPSFNFNRFWSGSLARAVAVKRLAAGNRRWNPEEAFIAGLVFRIGQLVLATTVPADYEPILRGAAGDDEALQACERITLDTDHLVIGCQLLQDWKLPETVWGPIEACAAFPRPAENDPERPPAMALLLLADAIAGFMIQDKSQQVRALDALILRAATLADLDRESFRAVLDQISQDWIAYGELLSIATAKPPDLDALETEAEEYRATLRLAAEIEVVNLRTQNQQLSQLASRDRLTGLFNRGAFDDLLAGSLVAATARNTPVGLLMIDLDYFKSINDQHGHPAGDAVLRHIARLFLTCTKTPTEVFRYGGEEFAVLVPGTDEAGTLALAEMLRQTIAQSPYLEPTKKISCTVSIGVAWASWPQHPKTAESLVQLADQRLYEAKQAGRNTCRPILPKFQNE
jgi:diguanylate cyclase (GGDEF)-like protein